MCFISAEQSYRNGVAADQITTMIKDENRHQRNVKRFWRVILVVLLVAAIFAVLVTMAMREGNYPSVGAFFQAAKDRLYEITQ